MYTREFISSKLANKYFSTKHLSAKSIRLDMLLQFIELICSSLTYLRNRFTCVVIFVRLSYKQNVFALRSDAIAKVNSCIIDSNDVTAVCKGGFYSADNFSNVSALVCSIQENYFNPHILSEYPNLCSFTLFRSFVEELDTDFPENPQLKILNLTYNNIRYIRPSVFQKLDSLTILDLRFNKLRSFNPEVVSKLKSIKNVFLYGNQWNCNKELLWIVENSSTRELITDADQLVCFTFKEKPVLAVMQMIHTLKLECEEIIDHCVCSLEHVVRVGSVLRPMITVDCSYKKLQKLPRNLPNCTSTLIMSGNQISDLSPLRHDEKYLNLLTVYLDYNNISSIDILVDSPFLSTFTALSLLGNKLSEVPVHSLEQAFEKNMNIAKVTLGQNPWTCNCEFTAIFKDFLAKYHSVIEDISNVTCSYRANDDKSLLPILSLSRNKLCHEPYKFKISALNVLNVCMTILLVVILLDFAYNYYMYKRYSKLPWIAKRLP